VAVKLRLSIAAGWGGWKQTVVPHPSFVPLFSGVWRTHPSLGCPVRPAVCWFSPGNAQADSQTSWAEYTSFFWFVVFWSFVLSQVGSTLHFSSLNVSKTCEELQPGP
jgi:hypothetical protein